MLENGYSRDRLWKTHCSCLITSFSHNVLIVPIEDRQDLRIIAGLIGGCRGTSRVHVKGGEEGMPLDPIDAAFV